MKISVVMPIYNSGKTLARAINSYASQDYEPKELIVIDGGSTDETPAVIAEMKQYIDVYVSEPDNGYADALNKGIKRATGDFVIMLAADDAFLAHAFKRFANSVEEDTDIWCGGLVVCNSYGYLVWHSDEDLEALRTCCSLKNPATFFRRSVFERVGYYSEEYRCANDREFFLRCYLSGCAIQVSDELITLFSSGGMSDPAIDLLGPEEDKRISIQYGLPEEEAEAHYRRRLRIAQRNRKIKPVLDFANRIGVMRLVLLLTGRTDRLIPSDQMALLGLNDHDSAIGE